MSKKFSEYCRISCKSCYFDVFVTWINLNANVHRCYGKRFLTIGHFLFGKKSLFRQKTCVIKFLSHEELCLTKKFDQKFLIISILQLDSSVAFENCSKLF